MSKTLSKDQARNLLKRAKKQAKRELAKKKYIHYLTYTHRGKYKRAPHNEYISEKLDQIEKGEIDRLIIFMPPRHGKSMTVSESFPSYFIGKNPERRAIEASYGDSLAMKFGRLNRNKIDEFGKELFGIKTNKANSAVSNWSIEGHRGGMISAGIMGTITGEGADLIIIDDVIKNRQEANSQRYRERIWDEWQNTILTRLHPNGKIIIIMTRWHEMDLAGMILDKEPDKWTVVNLPAIAENENDLLGRNIGDALWPEHGFDEHWADEKKKEVGSMVWASLYQQRPSPQDGTIFHRKWWKFYKNKPSIFDEIIQSWDATFKDADSSDYVVGQVWGRIKQEYYLLDQVRDRMDIVATMNAIRSLSNKWNKAKTKLIEDKANGPAIISMLKRELHGIIPVNPEGGKVVRAQAVSPLMEAGNVYIPDPSIAPWVHDYIEEFAVFPNGKNDDQVDSTSQALNRLSNISLSDIF